MTRVAIRVAQCSQSRAQEERDLLGGGGMAGYGLDPGSSSPLRDLVETASVRERDALIGAYPRCREGE